MHKKVNTLSRSVSFTSSLCLMFTIRIICLCGLFHLVPLYSQSGYIKSYGSELNRMFAMKQTEDGGFAATGIYDYATTDADWDVHFIKFDADANIQWRMNCGSSNGDESGQNFIQTDDMGYLITGYRMTVVFEVYRFHILKIDSVGNIEWVKYYHYFYGDPGPIIKTADGGALISNFINSELGSIVMKIDSLGNVEWSKTIAPFVLDIIELPDGNYVWSCGDGFIVKVDTDGNMIWSRHHDTFDFMHDLVALDDNMLAGLGTKYGEEEPILTKFNSEGYPIWSTRYQFQPDLDFFQLIRVDRAGNNGFYLNGYLRYPPVTNRLPVLVYVDSTGSYEWGRLPNSVIGAPAPNGFARTSDGGSMLLVDAYDGGVGSYTVKFDTNGNAGCESDILPAFSFADTLLVIDSSLAILDYDLTGIAVEFNFEIPALPESTLICSLTPSCLVAPTGLFSSDVTMNSAKLHWDADPGAIKYKVQYRAVTSPAWISVNAITNSKTLTGLTANTTYKYRVRSLCADAPATPWSSVEEFTTLPLKVGEFDLRSSSAIWIYPNPNQGIFRLDISEFHAALNSTTPITFRLKNTLGEEIYTERIDPANLITNVYLPHYISNGIYMVELSTSEQVYVNQMIITK